MSDENKIEIEGKESKIKIEGGKDIEIEGDKNVIEIDAGEKDVEIEGDKNVIEIDAGEKEKKPKKDHIEIDKRKIKKGFGTAINFFKNKKVQNILIIVLLLSVIIFGVLIRTQNLGLLIDQTTGEYIPTALDPFYFLRAAETIIQEGELPNVDVMRYPSAQVGFTKEILPGALVLLYKISSIFDKDITLRFVDVISPVIFFALGLIVFFFLVYLLTKSKSIALISSIFLSFIPTYLYRTLAGFADHEAIGMFAFFLTLLGYGLSLKFLEKKKNLGFLKPVLFGLMIGFLSAFVIASWGGISKFIFMIIPLSFGLFWLIKVKNLEHEKRKYLLSLLIFYLAFFISSILFGNLYGFGFSSMIGKVFLSSSSIINGAVLLFLIVDFSLIKFKEKISFIKKENLEKYRFVYSAIVVLIFGVIFLSIFKGGLFSLVSDIINGFIHPFGTGRTGLTVAENRQPYLNEWITQTGKIFFWLFVAGLVALGVEFAKGINKKKYKIWFGILWVVFISGVLFSRVSSTSLFNGENFISRLFYIGSLIIFFGYMVWVYLKDKINIGPGLLVLFSWAFFMLISARGALRLFFVITPFVCLSAGLFIRKIYDYTKNAKDDLLKLILGIILVLTIIGAVISFANFYKLTDAQAESTGPSANLQWQRTMSWVRNRTPLGSIFVHWWDYGHWVTYLGERKVLTDGGHAVGYWDHLIGRYVLTTPKPETALSFMKTHNVSHLLIDPTDFGKYGAYSSIGSGPEGTDRLSQIPLRPLDPSQTRETNEKETRVYVGGVSVDQDIIYNEAGQDIFLPEGRAASAATMIEFSGSGENIEFSIPYEIFIYNNQQISIPVRYLYFDGKMIDFEGGIDAVVMIIPSISFPTGTNVQINNLGVSIYLSPKVSKGLFAQLYLMNDPFNKYPTIKIAHSEQDPLINSLNFQGAEIKDFAYYGNLRGPIKIWKVDYPSNIAIRDEFLRTSGDYAEFDNLKFTI